MAWFFLLGLVDWSFGLISLGGAFRFGHGVWLMLARSAHRCYIHSIHGNFSKPPPYSLTQFLYI